MGVRKKLLLFVAVFLLSVGKRTRDFAFVSLCYGRSGEEISTGYDMAASGRMQYDYKQTNKTQVPRKKVRESAAFQALIVSQSCVLTH